MTDLPINQIKTIEKKLIAYDKPFIDDDFLQKIVDKFAPHYKPFQLSAKGLLSVIKNGKLYKNNLYRGYVSSYAILGRYMENTTYMVGGLYLYNRYGFTTQLADRMTVYNTVYSGKREIAGAKFIFKRVRPSFFRGKEKRQSVKESQGIVYYRMTLERAVIQLLIETEGKPEFANDIYYQLKTGSIDSKKLMEFTKKYVPSTKQQFILGFLAGSKT